MLPVRPFGVLIVLLFVAPVLAGCFGDDAPSPATAEDAPTDMAGERGPVRLVDGNMTLPLGHWMEGAPRDLPSLMRLGQLDHWETEQGAMRLLTDGKAFVLVVDQSLAPHAPGTFVFVRVHTDDGGTIATGLWEVRDEARTQVPVAVVPNDIIRFGVAYRYEVIVFAPDGPPDCRCRFTSATNEGGLEIGNASATALDAPKADLSTKPHVPTNAWNGTVMAHHEAPLSFRPKWDLAFDGPADGTDRPDPLEDALLGGPATGLYTFTFTGERVWLVDLLFDFAHSRIAGTEPNMRGNGTSSLQVQLDGWQPLSAYLALPPSKGIEQRFTMEVRIDHESQDDLPGEEEQYFFVTAAVGYRFGGDTYVADTDGRDLVVRVESTV